jgi:hypothetical protein
VFYYLPQSLALTHFYGLWGVNMDALMKPTVEDVLRIIGVLLTDEEMQDYIPDIISRDVTRVNGNFWTQRLRELKQRGLCFYRSS